MGKYFVRDTPLAGLEREMMLPPNFAPRGSGSAILCGYSPHGTSVDCQSCVDHRRKSTQTLVCLHVTKRLQAGSVTIVELAAEMVQPWKHLELKQRAVGIAGRLSGFHFEDQLHVARMLKMTKGEEEFVNSHWLAAVYLLSAHADLRHEGFTVGPEADDLLPVELDGQRLCLAAGDGRVRYREEDVADDSRRSALDRVTAVIRTTSEYMSQMETAPPLTASGLEGDYRVLAEFNDTVLAGYPTKYGCQFVTWERVQNRTALHQGDYYGPGAGVDSYTAAKRDFTVRSGLVPGNAIFSPEQLTEVYRSIHETLDSGYPITDERQKRLESAAEQIELSDPNLAARVEQSKQKELELASMETPNGGGMQFS